MTNKFISIKMYFFFYLTYSISMICWLCQLLKMIILFRLRSLTLFDFNWRFTFVTIFFYFSICFLVNCINTVKWNGRSKIHAKQTADNEHFCCKRFNMAKSSLFDDDNKNRTYTHTHTITKQNFFFWFANESIFATR